MVKIVGGWFTVGTANTCNNATMLYITNAGTSAANVTVANSTTNGTIVIPPNTGLPLEKYANDTVTTAAATVYATPIARSGSGLS